MKTQFKFVGLALLIFFGAPGLSAMTFNHINPWAGIILLIVSEIFLINYFIKQVQKQIQK